MTNHFAADVLICGAGPCGLTLALELARRNISFRLVDSLHEPFQGSRGKGIQSRSQEIFEDLGVLNRLVAAGGLYPLLRSYRGDGTYVDAEMAERIEPSAAEPYHIPLMVPQFITERILRERLAELGARAEFGHELLGFEQDAEGVTATIAGKDGEKTRRFRWLVGADGGRSFVRQVLGVDFPGKTLGARAIVADVQLIGLSRDVAHRFAPADDMDRLVWIGALAGTDLFQIQAPVGLEDEVAPTPEGLTKLVIERSGRSEIAVKTVSWVSDYQMNARLADRYRVGRVLLAGDAAHIHPPTGGQGLNTSIQDAYNLAWKLAAVIRGAGDALLDSYESERRPVAAEMLGLTTRLLSSQQKGEMRRGREVRQLDIGYPGSPLSLVCTGRDGPLMPGDRAPDAPVHGAAGQPTRLFDLFKGTHWTLLVNDDGGPRIAPRPGLHIHRFGPDCEILDVDRHIRDAYGFASRECALVRPDGYVAAIVGAGEASKLESYLNDQGLVLLEGEPN